MLKPVLVAAVVLLAACGQPAPAPPTNSAASAETGYVARVQALAPGQREGVLFRAVQATGGGTTCQGIDRVETRPPTRAGQPVWRVTCAGGRQWAVALRDDGTALVTGVRD